MKTAAAAADNAAAAPAGGKRQAIGCGTGHGGPRWRGLARILPGEFLVISRGSRRDLLGISRGSRVLLGDPGYFSEVFACLFGY